MAQHDEVKIKFQNSNCKKQNEPCGTIASTRTWEKFPFPQNKQKGEVKGTSKLINQLKIIPATMIRLSAHALRVSFFM